MTKTPFPPAEPRFRDHLDRAVKLLDRYAQAPIGPQATERRAELLLQVEIAQQARIANLLTIASTPGMPQSSKVLATLELFEETPGEEGSARLRPDVVKALGTTVDLLDYLVKSLVDAEYLGTPAAEEDTLEDLDRCSNCGGPDDDGEGYDGYCGNCADRATCEQCGERLGEDDLTVIQTPDQVALCISCVTRGQVAADEEYLSN